MKNLKLSILLSFTFLFSIFSTTQAQNNFLGMNGSGFAHVISDCTLPISGNSPITIEFLMRKESTTNAWLLGFGQNAAASGNRYHFGINFGELTILTPSSSNLTGFNITINEWHHYALTWDGSTLTVYVDGNSVFTTALSAQNVSANNAIIGHVSNGGGSFDGQMDEARIWNVARTQTEIQDNMNAQLNGNEAGLQLYYNFNQGTCGGDNTGMAAPQIDDITGNSCGGHMNGVAFNLTGCVANFVCEDQCGIPGSLPTIPTMGEWALIIFGLIIASFGVITVMRWQREQQIQSAF